MSKNWQKYRQQNLEKYHLRIPVLEKLYESMPRRMLAEIEAQGGPTKY